MRLLMFVVLSLLPSSVGVGVAEPQEMRELYTTRNATGERVFRVPENRLLATKKWSPESADPPLSVQAAVNIGLKRLSPKQPNRLRVTQVQLIASGGQEWRWFYRIELYDLTTASRARGPEQLEVLVLMDGSVVEPSSAGPPR